jgi:hypothetical protein
MWTAGGTWFKKQEHKKHKRHKKGLPFLVPFVLLVFLS